MKHNAFILNSDWFISRVEPVFWTRCGCCNKQYPQPILVGMCPDCEDAHYEYMNAWVKQLKEIDDSN